MKYSPTEMNNKINEYNFNFKKKFGQNFIIDENVIDNIVEKADICENSLVIEVGPGSGALTYKLAKKAKQVICYEIDTTLKSLLEDNLKEYNNVKIIYEDFLKTNVKEELGKAKYDKVYLIANLPYYITTPIITKVIDEQLNIDKLVVMVQKEVGDRFKAKPNSKSYNSLSIFLQYNYDITKLLDVSRNVFFPKPNVDSIVVSFTKKEPLKVKNIERFNKLVKDSFVQKRKTLKNNLSHYDLEKIDKVLQKNGFSITSRAEQIPIEVFVDISNEL